MISVVGANEPRGETRHGCFFLVLPPNVIPEVLEILEVSEILMVYWNSPNGGASLNWNGASLNGCCNGASLKCFLRPFAPAAREPFVFFAKAFLILAMRASVLRFAVRALPAFAFRMAGGLRIRKLRVNRIKSNLDVDAEALATVCPLGGGFSCLAV